MTILYSVSPHVRSDNSTKKIMLYVCIALLFPSIMGVIYFGYLALLGIIICSISAVLSEVIYRLIMHEKIKSIIDTFDYSSLVTGMIIALIIPATPHLYIGAFASIFAVIAAKMLFGGTGNNFVNPAAAGRIFAFISFTTVMNTYVFPSVKSINESVITGATSLQSLLNDGTSLSIIDLALGTGVAGCVGETCKVAILVGAIFLAIKGIIKIWLPLLTLIFAGITAVLLSGFNFSIFIPSILSGGLFFGAFFMATDYVTNPTTTKGNVIFFIALGILTSLLRKFTGYETISFVILLMNILVPLIDKISYHKPFGYVKIPKEAKK